MNRELIMLRSYKRVKRLAESLTEDTHFKIVKSYAREMMCDDTQAQFRDICRQIQLRDACLLFCSSVINALAITDKPLRALLMQVYFKHVEPDSIARRYRVSTTAVYRKLHQARSQFKRKLNYLGYTSEWFRRNFGDIDFIAERL